MQASAVASQALFCDMRLFDRLEKALNHLPERPFWPAPPEPDFVTNDYLALRADGILTQLLQGLPPDLWRGSGASRYLGGDHPIYHELEAYLSQQYGGQALLFASGFVANITLWEALAQRGDTILYDRAIHASIRHGLRLSQAKAWGFPHNDWDAAEKLLRRANGEVFLVVESLYSMLGDSPDPAALQYLQARYGCHLFIDEAHTTLLYPDGRGWCEQHGLRPLLRLLTFGKAVGLMGGTLIVPPLIRTYLQRRCIGTIYSTALPPLIAAGALSIFQKSALWKPRQERLWQLTSHLRSLLDTHGILYEGLAGPIAMVPHPAPGFSLKRLLPPTVPQPQYRISLHANHTPQLLEALVQSLCTAQS